MSPEGTAGLAGLEARLEQRAPGYLARVRQAAAELGVRSGASGDQRALLADVAALAEIDVEVPTVSRRRSARAVKLAVKRLTGWYLRYVGQQVTAFGQAVTQWGTAVADRADALEGTVEALRREVRDLAARVERLDGERPAPPERDGTR